MKRIISAILSVTAAAALFVSCAPAKENAVTSSSDDYIRYTARLPKAAIVKVGSDADGYGFDLSAFDDDGYVLTVKEGLPVVLAKTETGLVLASRYFEKHLGDGEYTKVYGEGYKVGNITVAGVPLAEFAVVYETCILDGFYDEAYRYAAEEFAKWIKDASGIELPVFHGDAPGYAHVVRIRGDVDAGLVDDGYETKVEGGDLIITGTKRGELYGVYEFLEKVIGYRFITYAQTYLYESDLIEVPEGYYDRYVPQFIQRSVWSDRSGNYPYADDLSGADYAVKRHALSSYVQNYGKYGYAGLNEASHGYYEYIKSVDGGKQPCLTDPDLLDECIENVIAELKRVEATEGLENEIHRSIGLGHNDNNRFCECKNCRKLWAEEGGYSGLNVRFCNAVADAVNEEFDVDITIKMFAYWGAPEPPKKTKPNAHVSVTYCMYQLCWSHPLGDLWCDPGHPGYENLTNVKHLDYLREWCDITENKVIIYWYGAGHHNAMCPVSWYKTLRDDMRLMAEAGAEGIMTYGNHENGMLGDLGDYVSMKLAWNPYMSDVEYDAMIDEFLMIYYGEAGEAVKELAEIYSNGKLYTRCQSHSFDSCMNYEYMAEQYDKVMEYTDLALSLVKSDVEESRVKWTAGLAVYAAVCGAYDDRYVNGTEEEKAEITERYRQAYDFLRGRSFTPSGEFDPDVHPFVLAGQTSPLV